MITASIMAAETRLSNINLGNMIYYGEMLGAVMGTSIGVKQMFESMAEKAGLKTSIRDLQNQLELDDREELIRRR